jgi:hypothetical protein
MTLDDITSLDGYDSEYSDEPIDQDNMDDLNLWRDEDLASKEPIDINPIGIEKVNATLTGCTGVYQQKFESIRNGVTADLQRAGAEYVMSVQGLVKTCIGSNLELANLAELHCKYLVNRMRKCNAKLLNCTTSNAIIEIDGKAMIIEFDLSKSQACIQSAKHIKPIAFGDNLDIMSELMLLKYLQVFMNEPIDDANIVVPYNQLMNSVAGAKSRLNESKNILAATILSRAFTAFDFQPGMNFYTLNFSDDLSMLFWDRYAITEMTMKSYYVEQHCIIEHTVTGDVEQERFICVHKPSKNSMASFLSTRLACLTDMVRPVPTVDTVTEVKVDLADDEDEPFTDEEAFELFGIKPEDRK